MIAPIEELVRNLSRLPGFGRRSSARAALALLRDRERLLDPLVLALQQARSTVTCCRLCGAFTTFSEDPCRLCTDVTRTRDILCVVEEPADIMTIEAAGAFRGRYHVLGGKLSPTRHLGPERLRLAELKSRIANEGIREVLLALSTDMEGDATIGYLTEFLHAYPGGTHPVRLSRLAFGLPADSGVGYADPLTLRRAILSRQEIGD